MINWAKYFDHIYCISLVDNYGKREFLNTEFERIGIDIHSDLFSYKITVKNKMYDYAYTSDNVYKDTIDDGKQVARFYCSIAHYEIWKEAYALGYNNILILEDDLKFLLDVNAIEQYLEEYNTIKPNIDVCMFDKIYNGKIPLLELFTENASTNYVYYNRSVSSGACYAVNRKAIQVFIEAEESVFYPADYIINSIPDTHFEKLSTLTHVFIKNNLAIQNILLGQNLWFTTIYVEMNIDLYNYYDNVKLELKI